MADVRYGTDPNQFKFKFKLDIYPCFVKFASILCFCVCFGIQESVVFVNCYLLFCGYLTKGGCYGGLAILIDCKYTALLRTGRQGGRSLL